MQENMKTYTSILNERKRTLVNNYLMKNQDDLERILDTLYDHFLVIQKTSFDDLSRENLEATGSKELITKSNEELKRLQKELNQQKIEKDDIRYDIFRKIYEMIGDNINLRLKMNNYIEGILEQTNQKMERMISGFNRKFLEDNPMLAANPTLKAKKQSLTKGFEDEFGENNSDVKDGEFGKRKIMRSIIFDQKPTKDKNRMCSWFLFLDNNLW